MIVSKIIVLNMVVLNIVLNDEVRSVLKCTCR